MKYIASALVLIAILVPAFFLVAEGEEPIPSTLQGEMKALNITMKEIAGLLEKHVASQESDLLIKRVDLTNRTLMSRREELRSSRSEVVGLTEEESMLRINLEGWRAGLDQGSVAEEDRETLEVEAEQVETRLKSLVTRRQDLERRIVELENAVLTLEEDMRIMEDVLDEKLGLR